MFDVWIDVYDPTYTFIVGNPLRPLSAAFTRKLDEAGNGQASFMADPRSLTILQEKRVCEIWFSEVKTYWDNGAMALQEEVNKRMLGAFVVNSIQPDPKTRIISAKGPGVMTWLADKITLPGLKLDNVSVTSALTTIADIAGWSVNAEAGLGSQYISMPFAGSNVLNALQAICESQGVHLRMGSADKTIDAGAFGTNPDSLLVEYIEGEAAELAFRSDAPILIDNADVMTDARDVVNWVVAYGGGDGDAALTMEGSTRAWVEDYSANGRSHYIVKDNFSIGEYGQIERRLNMKKINPTDTTDAAVLNARNAVADATKQWLDRHSSPYKKLGLDVRNVNSTIQPGNQIHLRYLGTINKLGVPYQEWDIDEAYWVMAVTETVTPSDGLRVSLDVANVDRYEQNAAGIVVGLMDAVEVQGINIQPYPLIYPFSTGREPIDTVTAVETQFHVLNATLRLNSVKLVLVRDYWTAVAGTALGGGNHRHVVALFKAAYPFNSGALGNMEYEFAGSTSVEEYVAVTTRIAASVATTWYTQGASDEHGHETEFKEVKKDTQLPLQLGVQINGTSVASNIFPVGTPASTLFAEIDITAAVKSKAGGFRGLHDCIISCGQGRGDLVAIFVIDVDIGRIR